MNRAARRSLQRSKGVRVPLIRIGDLTVHEAEIVEEALDLYLREQWAFVEGEPDDQQRWVISRAQSIKDGLYAAIHGTAWADRDRTEAPTGESQ